VQKVSELLALKGGAVHATEPESTVLAAAQKMNDHKIGALVVTQGGTLAGIVTERDMLTRVIAGQLAPARTKVRDIMTSQVLTCTPDTSLADLRQLMRSRRIRHIPVLNAGRIAGMISIGDLNIAETQTLTETIGFLEAYIAG
jgi:CBS domain-containing protein